MKQAKQTTNVKSHKKTSKFYNSTINKRIRNFLDSPDTISAQEFATKINVKYESVRQWRSGYSRPDIDKIYDIAKVLNCSVEYLLNESAPKKIENTNDFGLSEQAIISLRKLYTEDFSSPLLPDYKPHYEDYDITNTNIISHIISNTEFWITLRKQVINTVNYFADAEYKENFNNLVKDNISPFDLANNIISREFNEMFKKFVKNYLENTYPDLNINDI